MSPGSRESHFLFQLQYPVDLPTCVHLMVCNSWILLFLDIHSLDRIIHLWNLQRHVYVNAGASDPELLVGALIIYTPALTISLRFSLLPFDPLPLQSLSAFLSSYFLPSILYIIR